MFKAEVAWGARELFIMSNLQFSKGIWLGLRMLDRLRANSRSKAQDAHLRVAGFRHIKQTTFWTSALKRGR